jgi:glycosyltransferase involved in cell wall biosynthesis
MKDNRNKINLMVLIVSMPVGGVETQILSIVQRLNRKNYNTKICCIRENGVLGEKAAAMGIDIVSLNLMKSSRFSFSISRAISEIIKGNNVHILWTHQYVANLYGRIASWLARSSIAVPTFHVLYDSPKMHRRIFNHLLSYGTDTMVGVSNAVAHDIKRYDRVSKRKIKVIYNGIDIQYFDRHISKEEARKLFNLPPDGLIIGSVGRVTEQKGHRYLIEAAAKLKNNYVVIAGDGPLAGELKRLADGLNINFIFLGELSYDQIPKLLHAIDIFCFPSLWEGFGISLVEAMASGLPIVASDIPPHREVIGDAGILVPVGNESALADKLKNLIADVSLRESLGKKAKDRANNFSVDNTANAYNELFTRLLKGKKSA